MTATRNLQAISSALKEVTAPLIGSTVTPIVVFLPLVAIHGVYGTFFRALAINANWRSEAAQQAVIELATNPDKAADAADRISAVDALAYAVRYQVKGVRQDPQMFKALVTLLDDKNEEVRVMASNILAPIRDSDFRGDLGRPERKSPL